ncbi:hypothetical protein CACET_c34840 [Clostridium aceticum]|uniref:Lysozyme inhibitor LprI-like N-terminal domain-containing protein n=2 Tax=Clostridium aceticum TaxID=84022 RepID=A0A0D8I8E5_9CLOT|nr:lysozyme inhibitor LprI family protein [Clostridium aceticum]AKL96927.1 hypothetical protein CACET_c34840 [Clostridium aceticum]KJF25501.1 lipoprotein [Clostridium aceticum]
MLTQKKVVILLIILSIFTLVACTNGNEENQRPVGVTEENQLVENNLDQDDTTDEENYTAINVTKIEGRRQEFLEKLDNIQKELDALPEKSDSDAGVTSAMRSYYGKSYDMYDEALNEIYAILKEELSPETMKNLQTEQIKWIKQKEDDADKAAAEFQGGTFEFVAYNVVLYESTKARCYELVNEYMTD